MINAGIWYGVHGVLASLIPGIESGEFVYISHLDLGAWLSCSKWIVAIFDSGFTFKSDIVA